MRGLRLNALFQIISRDLGGSTIATFWAGTSFLLASTVFQPIIVCLSHEFGRKEVTLLILGIFTVGAIIGASAKNLPVLLLGRTVQGIGGGGIIMMANVLVTDMVPLRDRGVWFGVIAAVWAIGSVTGPIIGGAFAQGVSWRWIFWINLPICVIGFITLTAFLKLQKRPGSIRSKVWKVDWIGAVLLVASATSFLMPISWGGVLFTWGSWRTLVPLILGTLGLVIFVIYEHFFTLDPLIPLRVFTPRTAAVNYIGTAIHGIILWCLLYYLPLYYEAVKGYSPIMTGVAIFPETFTIAPVVILVGIAVSITGRFRWAIWAGWTLTTLGMGLLYLLSPTTSIAAFVFLNLVPGFGTGLLFASTEFAIQAANMEKDAGSAEAMFTFIRNLGESIGVGIGGIIFQSRLRVELSSIPSLADRAVEYSREASSLVEVIKAMPDDSNEKHLLIAAYANSLKVVWAVMAALAFIALLLSTATQGLSLNRELETEQGFIHEAQSDSTNVTNKGAEIAATSTSL